MNRLESDQVVDLMASPHAWEPDEEQRTVWHHSALQGIGLDIGLDVAMRLVESEERFPTPARFNKERALVDRERYLTEREEDRQQALPGVPTSADVRRDALGRMRTTLATMSRDGARGHWHGGPDPCPVCGGINPAVLAAADPEERIRLELAVEVIKSDQRKRLGV